MNILHIALNVADGVPAGAEAISDAADAVDYLTACGIDLDDVASQLAGDGIYSVADEPDDGGQPWADQFILRRRGAMLYATAEIAALGPGCVAVAVSEFAHAVALVATRVGCQPGWLLVTAKVEETEAARTAVAAAPRLPWQVAAEMLAVEPTAY